jgi:hypothetical protein
MFGVCLVGTLLVAFTTGMNALWALDNRLMLYLLVPILIGIPRLLHRNKS